MLGSKVPCRFDAYYLTLTLLWFAICMQELRDQRSTKQANESLPVQANFE